MLQTKAKSTVAALLWWRSVVLSFLAFTVMFSPIIRNFFGNSFIAALENVLKTDWQHFKLVFNDYFQMKRAQTSEVVYIYYAKYDESTELTLLKDL